MAMGTRTHLQDIVDQLQLFPFRTRDLKLRVSAAMREFGDIVAVIGKKDEVVNGL
jgi:hypothetical protein